jgi:hypothetical protein
VKGLLKVDPRATLPYLMDLLKRLAKSVGKRDKDALQTWHRIVLGHDRLERRKLDVIVQQRSRQRLEHAKLDEYPQEFAIRLVRYTTRSMAGVPEQLAVAAGNEATLEDLSPVERRAVALLSGAAPEPTKSVLEDRATKLADAVRAERPTRSVKQKQRRGRPPSARGSIVGNPEHAITIPVSIDEAVQIVLPAIQALKGSKIMASVRGTLGEEILSSEWLEAVHVAVQVLRGTVDLQSVRRAVARANALKKRKDTQPRI